MLAIGKWIVAALAANMSGLIGRVLMAMGIGYATYNFAMPEFLAMAQSAMGSLPANAIAIMAAIKADVAITIIFSAIAARMASRIIFRKV